VRGGPVTAVPKVSIGSLHAEDFPDFHDANLKRIFIVSEEKRSRGTGVHYAKVFYKNAKPNEFFFIRPYTRKLRFCEWIPDEGLTIWHINKNGSNSRYPETKLLVKMVHANRNISNTTTNVCFHAGGKKAFTNMTKPNSKWYNRKASGLAISSIGPVANVMKYKVGFLNAVRTAPLELSEENSDIPDIAVEDGAAPQIVSTEQGQEVMLRNSVNLLDMHGHYVLSLSGQIAEPIRIKVFKYSGQEVFNRIVGPNSTEEVSIAPGRGAYAVRVSTPRTKMTRRIFIQ